MYTKYFRPSWLDVESKLNKVILVGLIPVTFSRRRKIHLQVDVMDNERIMIAKSVT
jgi:pyruvate-formate lyase